MNRRPLRPRLNQGTLSRAARGEGIVCPKCKTFAPLGAGGACICTSCGCSISRIPIGGPAPAAPVKTVQRGKTPSSSANLGLHRSTLLEAAGVQEAPVGPVEPTAPETPVEEPKPAVEPPKVARSVKGKAPREAVPPPLPEEDDDK